uniref:Uncharacterized protein n=1 Tax=Lactuca sativa TaxID=4236 RepID=A0A9R1W6T8_LACSA|nr:hypothetical protein LSAT_V11C300101650 [Lactuca sativa]
MPNIGILIANKYGVIAHFLSKDESSTSFLLWSGPQDFPNHLIINIVLINGCHYIKVDLQDGHPLTIVSWLWNMHKSARSTGWKTLYHARLSAYVRPYRQFNNRRTERVNVSDN